MTPVSVLTGRRPACCHLLCLTEALSILLFFFFFNDTATTEIYTLSLHDALPISTPSGAACLFLASAWGCKCSSNQARSRDRKSTRLNSSHSQISYAVFCLKKKKSRGR